MSILERPTKIYTNWMSTNTFEKQILTYLKKFIVSNKTEQQEIFAEMKHELEKTLEQKTLRNGVMEVMM